jgi:hypothetical protein
MLDTFQHMPWIVREIVNIVVIGVGLRYYLMRDITTEIDKRGLLKDGLIHTTIRVVKTFLARQAAIWKHYKEAHDQEVVACGKDRCTVFSA